jgi:hypothetical protein
MKPPRDAIVRVVLRDEHGGVPCEATAAMQADPRGVTVLPLGADTSGDTLTLYGRDARRLAFNATEPRR